MSTTLSSGTGFPRIHVVDAVRGFALAGVALVHMVEMYLGAPMPEAQQAAMISRPIDKVVMGFDGALLIGKFYILFSLLFGLSFFIQMDRAHRRGIDFRGRFAWRLVILFGIGFLHHLFYRADILTTYAVLGLLLIPSYRLPSRWLLGLAAVLFLGAGRFLSFAAFGPAPFTGGELSQSAPWVTAYWDVLTQGSLWDVFSVNALGAYPPLLDFQYGVFGRGYITLGLFFLGLWLGRTRFFEGVLDQRRFVTRALWISSGASIAALLLGGLVLFLVWPVTSVDSWGTAVLLTVGDLFNLSFSGVWLFGFLALCQRGFGEKVVRAFAPYGRMALTNYVLLGVVGAFIYHGWGLGRLGVWRPADAAGAGLLLIALGLLASRLWLAHFHYGPLEWLWRSLTFMKGFPFRRRALPEPGVDLAAA